ncbi:MAG TPA: hypothetical protein VIX82_14430 [Solirubrobacteraceae bacterium]
MTSFRVEPAVAADAAAVTELRVALEAFHHGQSGLSRADVEDEWSDLDLEQTRASCAMASASLAMERFAKKASSGKPKDTFIPTRSGGGSAG